MCFSAYAQYAPRPVKANDSPSPRPAVASALAHDPNIFGQLAEVAPLHRHDHAPDEAAPTAGSPIIESVVVTMPDGRRLLITPLD